jgi:hypothetical protein
MNRRLRKKLLIIIATVTTSALVWLPTAAHAGIALNGID